MACLKSVLSDSILDPTRLSGERETAGWTSPALTTPQWEQDWHIGELQERRDKEEKDSSYLNISLVKWEIQ